MNDRSYEVNKKRKCENDQKQPKQDRLYQIEMMMVQMMEKIQRIETYIQHQQQQVEDKKYFYSYIN